MTTMKSWVVLATMATAVACAAGGCGTEMDDEAPAGAAAATTEALVGGCKASPSESSCSFKDPITEGCSADSSIVAFARNPGLVVAALRYSPSCQSAWTVAADDTSLNRRVRATIVSNDGLGSARDGSGTRTSEMLYVGDPARTVQAIGRVLDSAGHVLGLAQTAFIRP